MAFSVKSSAFDLYHYAHSFYLDYWFSIHLGLYISKYLVFVIIVILKMKLQEIKLHEKVEYTFIFSINFCYSKWSDINLDKHIIA